MQRHPFPAAARLAIAVTISAVARSAAAQSGAIDARCATSAASNPIASAVALIAQDACQKSIDVFGELAPQLGALVAGGSAELGSGGTLGGLGHASVDARATIVGGGRLPDLGNVSLSYTGAQQTNFGVRSQTLALPAVDAAIGLSAGVPIGLTRIGGFDLLLSGAYVPSFSSGQVRVERTGSALQLGYGGRLGLLERSRFVPGLGVTYLHRRLPETSILAATTDGGTIGVTGARVSTDSWRIAADQRVSVLGLTAGVGQDRYDARATVAASVPVTGVPIIGTTVVTFAQPVSQRLTRTNVYAGASLPAGGVAQFVAEIGRVSGGRANATFNGFSGRTPADPYTYVSLGVRAGR